MPVSKHRHKGKTKPRRTVKTTGRPIGRLREKDLNLARELIAIDQRAVETIGEEAVEARVADRLPFALSPQAAAKLSIDERRQIERGLHLSMDMILESMFGPKPPAGWTSSQVEAAYASLYDGT